jgi:hypothetical protein
VLIPQISSPIATTASPRLTHIHGLRCFFGAGSSGRAPPPDAVVASAGAAVSSVGGGPLCIDMPHGPAQSRGPTMLPARLIAGGAYMKGVAGKFGNSCSTLSRPVEPVGLAPAVMPAMFASKLRISAQLPTTTAGTTAPPETNAARLVIAARTSLVLTGSVNRPRHRGRLLRRRRGPAAPIVSID